MDCLASSGVKASGGGKPLPLDFSHHYSEVTKRRVPSEIKRAYELFKIPGIRNLSGGLPNPQFFPFDTLEAQAAKPERWLPSQTSPSKTLGDGPRLSQAAVASHIAVPKASGEDDVMKRIDVSTALQYGLAQGYPPLLSWVRQFARENLHPDVPYKGGPEVSMTCGSTDAFAKILHLFVNPWNDGLDDVRDRPGLLCVKLVYGVPLAEALPRGVQVVPIEADTSGMLVSGPGGLEDVLSNWDSTKGRRPHLMYTVTLGHNPTGNVLSLERQGEIYAVCSKYDVIIVEDEPYWYLQFPSAAAGEAESRGLSTSQRTTPRAVSSGYPFLDSLSPSFLHLDVDGRVVRLDTFSKTVAPGCRLGWVTAQPAVIERLVRITETSTQQPSGFVQALVAELVIGPQPEAKAAFARASLEGTAAKFSGWQMDGWVRWLEGLRGAYERRMQRMCRILDAGAHEIKTGHFVNSRADADWDVVTKTKLLDFSWPRGGMFIWLRVLFEKHPLWQAPIPNRNNTSGDATIDGPTLSIALLMFLTTKPYLIIVAPGSIFGATPAIRTDVAWAYYRLCFAAETDDNVDVSAKSFVEGLHRFWRIKSVAEIVKLAGSFPHAAAALDGSPSSDNSKEMGNMGTWFGC